MADETRTPKRALFGLSAAVYAQRDGKILVLKRAMGEATGGWYIPGGAVDPGEDVETAARRELFEEAGLVPDGPLTLISANHMHVYGGEALQLCYACDCTTGDVIISHEHSGFRWMEPEAYRERFLSDAMIEQIAATNEHYAALMRTVRAGLDDFIKWCDDQRVLRNARAEG